MYEMHILFRGDRWVLYFSCTGVCCAVDLAITSLFRRC